ncbi:LacI family DNA-binding transcriptional regulator [Biformimicrobium ophioploci]|uniref:LacI family DNA-binding transcriptional regulator n=1 Tax=Biformimicrobium ophioploci TaxID=3036711 RepID=A0ABQ6M0U5_9GAMM|nr:LacI family DNA-binding transcriptional regulator [Microbulbifer sp. NKW57]GMG87936.1 LacI family DNA-binding transcriptional regulator [Microbulbifer sp. NKW57]
MAKTKQVSNKAVEAEQGNDAHRGRVTSYDVAAHAGVSQSAVSRCFKPGASVSKKMRDRVMKAVEELGYRPNAIARGLITRRSNMVGVIVSNLNFYPEVLSELNKRFISRGVHVLLFALDQESDVGSILEQLWQYPVDGVVAAAHLTPEQIALFDERGVPLVFYNRAYQDVPVSSVCCDQSEGERMLVSQLAGSGKHKDFGIIAGPRDSVVSMQRTEGALARLKELGFDQVNVVSGDYTYESGRRAIGKLLEARGEMPDAIICANDMMAMGCMDELRFKHDLDVPGDVSVVGFDGVKAAAWASFNLTTVTQPVESMAEAVVTMLLDRIDNDGLPPEKRTFSGVLRSGGSIRQ